MYMYGNKNKFSGFKYSIVIIVTLMLIMLMMMMMSDDDDDDYYYSQHPSIFDECNIT